MYSNAIDYENWWDGTYQALKAFDTRRWDYVDVCLSGKNADLDSYQMGVKCDFEHSTEETLRATVHVGVTFPGLDVALAQEYDNDADYETALDTYMELAQEIVSAVGYPGDWTGDDWYIWAEFDIEALQDPERHEDNAKAIIAAADAVVEDWAREVSLAHELLNTLAGY